MGIRAANCTPKTGNFIGMHISYSDKGDVILASQKGQFIRMELTKIKRLGRDTQGVTLMKMRQGDKVSSVALILPDESDHNSDQSKIPLDNNTTGQILPDNSIRQPAEKNHTKYEDSKNNKSDKSDLSNKKIKVNYYEKNKMNKDKKKAPLVPEEKLSDEREDQPTGGLPQNPKSTLPAEKSEFKVKNYKDNLSVEINSEDLPSTKKGDTPVSEEVQGEKLKNPPFKKDEVNYWGKNK
jgi:DNA gyrase/topoisomerase IV subunit A